jgi:uncharacterized protein YkwD
VTRALPPGGGSVRAQAARAVVALAALIATGCGGGNADASPALAGGAEPDVSAGPSPGGSILQLLNATRAAPRTCGETRHAVAPPLAVNGKVEAAAASHTNWMQANRTMSHSGEAGSSVGARLTATGYQWSAVGENVAMGQASPEAVVASWLASPGHCANIMNPTFVDAGFSFAPVRQAMRR